MPGRGGKGAVREGIVSLLGGGEGAQVAVRQLCRGELRGKGAVREGIVSLLGGGGGGAGSSEAVVPGRGGREQSGRV